MDFMQTRFLYLINKVSNSGKTFSNKDYANKILGSMCREFQPKFTTTIFFNNLSTLDITKLFRKLAEHENELKRLAYNEVKSKKRDK